MKLFKVTLKGMTFQVNSGTDNACRKKELSQSICSICREVSRLKQERGK